MLDRDLGPQKKNPGVFTEIFFVDSAIATYGVTLAK